MSILTSPVGCVRSCAVAAICLTSVTRAARSEAAPAPDPWSLESLLASGASQSPAPTTKSSAPMTPNTPAPPAHAEPKLNVAITPYIWMPSLSGDLTVRGIDFGVDATFIDVIDEADTVFGLMGALDLEYDRLIFQLNAAWMTVEVSDERSVLATGTLAADIDINATWVEFFGGYRFIDESLEADPASRCRLTLDGFVGGRVTMLDVDTTLTASAVITLPDGSVLTPTASREVGDSEDWFEPFLGARLGFDLTENWELGIRGDIGGFGWGSDFAWQAVGGIGYRWYFDNWSLALFGGYRALGQDYTDGNFTWDIITHGPLLGLSFAF